MPQRKQSFLLRCVSKLQECRQRGVGCLRCGFNCYLEAEQYLKAIDSFRKGHEQLSQAVVDRDWLWIYGEARNTQMTEEAETQHHSLKRKKSAEAKPAGKKIAHQVQSEGTSEPENTSEPEACTEVQSQSTSDPEACDSDHACSDQATSEPEDASGDSDDMVGNSGDETVKEKASSSGRAYTRRVSSRKQPSVSLKMVVGCKFSVCMKASYFLLGESYL